ncbi:MAG: LapA family protein [Alphaproteobacteria bacterium]|nr:LapA family protein [Alphaproteobacteria bacterium]
MLRLLKALIGLPIAVIVVVFAVSNRQTALVSLWPLPFEVATPVFFLALAPLALGVFLGGMAAWLAGGKSRRLSRERARQLKAFGTAPTPPALGGS